jgi:hypothetical protein
LKNIIGERLKINSSLLRFFWKQVELIDGELKIFELGIQSGDQIVVSLKSSKPMVDILRDAIMSKANIEQSKDLSDCKMISSVADFSIRDLLSCHEENFNCLFSLLSIRSDSMIKRVWKLICSLPINERVNCKLSLQGLKSVDFISWDVDFDKGDLLKTLYSLQVSRI